jgi:NAD(P)H-hydrate repair Nnr-like enzyme with NAD(P)H-hydrate dehydratase domain
LNSKHRLAEVAATGAFIHNSAAVMASKGGPISASSIIDAIPAAVGKLL